MTLSDRLAEAARRRAGLSTGDDPGALLARPLEAQREVTVVIGAHIPVTTVQPDPEADADAVCPTCGRTGELGVIDLHRGTSDWSCPACGTLWRITLPPSARRRFR